MSNRGYADLTDGNQAARVLLVTAAGASVHGGGLSGGTTSLTTTAAIVLSTTLAITQVLVQNDPDNLVDVLVGSSSAQVIQLTPGQAVTIVTSDLANVYAKNVSSTTQSVNWLATTG